LNKPDFVFLKHSFDCVYAIKASRPRRREHLLKIAADIVFVQEGAYCSGTAVVLRVVVVSQDLKPQEGVTSHPHAFYRLRRIQARANTTGTWSVSVAKGSGDVDSVYSSMKITSGIGADDWGSVCSSMKIGLGAA
jgi:hypothetical protein